MSASIPQRAAAIYAAGIQPWPVKHDGTKSPRGAGWSPKDLPKRLSEAETLALFDDTDTGLGVICGTVSGFLELFELEGRFVNSDDFDTFMGLIEEDEVLSEAFTRVRDGYEARSPSGGMHFMFRTNEPSPGNTKLAMRPSSPEELAHNPKETHQTLIETRGTGGFAIFAGSNGKIHPTGGKWSRVAGGPSSIAQITVAERDALYALAESFDEMPAPKMPLGLSAAPGGATGSFEEHNEWVMENISVEALLAEGGWHSPFFRRAAGTHLWTRPGKESRDGPSLELFPDGGVSVYTTTLSEAWVNATLPGESGGYRHATPTGVLAAVRFKGDFSAAASWVRLNGLRSAAPAVPSNVDAETGEVRSALNLPSEFWNSRPALQHIKQAAEATMTVPDAVLGSTLGRYAAMVPTTVKIPGIIGAQATFDYITCIVAASSGGKSISNGVAKQILPGRRSEKWVLFDAPAGSGEGLVQAFMGYEKDEKGKKIGEPSYKFGKHKSIHFTVDEGTAIIEAQSRSGTTLVQTLCSAWSGSGLGQMNAAVDTNRLVPAGKRRMAATVNIQTSLAPQLFDSALIGLPKRMVFFWAHGEMPDEMPAHPGELDVSVPNGWDMIQEIELAACAEIYAEVRETRRVVMTGETTLDDLDGHRGLLKLKTAGLLALMEGRRDIDIEDWGLAEQIMKCSERVRQHTVAVKTAADRASADAKTIAFAEREFQVDEHKERKGVASLRAGIIRKVEAGDISRAALRKATTKSGTRHRFDDALNGAVGDGAIKLTPDGNNYTSC